MPDFKNSVPLLEEKVSKVGTKNEGNDMPNTAINDIDIFVRDHIQEIMVFIRDKCDEKNITNDELMNITKIAHSSFYRLWKLGKVSEEGEKEEEDKRPFRPNADHVCRMCLALGVSLDEFQRTPTEKSVVFLPALPENQHEEIMNNLWGEIASQREIITRLEQDNSKLEAENQQLTKIVFSREEDIRSNISRINKLTDALIDRHDHMHEMNKQHNERVDRLDAALRVRYDQLYSLFSKIVDKNPQKIVEMLNSDEDEIK